MFFRTFAATIGIAISLVLAGCGRATVDPADAASVVRVEVNETGFSPESVDLAPDVPSILEFVRTAENTCATAIVFSESDIRHELPLNEAVRVSVRPGAGERFAFACPMDMYKGAFSAEGSTADTGESLAPGSSDTWDIRVDQRGFHPSRIQVPAGTPTVLRFTRTAEKTCNTAVVIPSLGIERELPLNETVEVTFTPDAPGEIAFSCPMEMATGVIEVPEGAGQ